MSPMVKRLIRQGRRMPTPARLLVAVTAEPRRLSMAAVHVVVAQFVRFTGRSDHAVALGDWPIRRSLGWYLPDHRLLVLDVLQHRNVLIRCFEGRSNAARRGHG